MRSMHIPRLVLAAALAMLPSVALVGTGCSSPPRTGGAGATAASDMLSVADLIGRGQVQVSETLAALAALEAMDGGTLPELFAAYERDLAELRRIATEVGATRDRMRAEGDAYFERWDEQIAAIDDTTIRGRSEDRRRLVSRSLEGLQVDFDRLADDYARFEGMLVDLQRALSVDLNPGGVAAVRESMAAAAAQGRRLTDTAGRVAASFEALGVNMGAAPVGVPIDDAGDGAPDRVGSAGDAAATAG